MPAHRTPSASGTAPSRGADPSGTLELSRTDASLAIGVSRATVRGLVMLALSRPVLMGDASRARGRSNGAASGTGYHRAITPLGLKRTEIGHPP